MEFYYVLIWTKEDLIEEDRKEDFYIRNGENPGMEQKIFTHLLRDSFL